MNMIMSDVYARRVSEPLEAKDARANGGGACRLWLWLARSLHQPLGGTLQQRDVCKLHQDVQDGVQVIAPLTLAAEMFELWEAPAKQIAG